jgi:phosphomannomutase/phosphoglucomutase
MEYQYKKDLDKNIFRGYDIRGVYPTSIDEDTCYKFGLGFGTHIKRLGFDKCVIGHDNRLSSPSLYQAMIKGLLETGVHIMSLGLCTTPMYYYACIKLGIPSGAMITASHNPKDENGIKFAFDENGNCKGQEIQDFMEELIQGDFVSGEGTIEEYLIEPDYVDLYRDNLHFGERLLKVVLDPGNGTTANFCKEIYSMFPMELTIINGESDGNFPNHHPDPCVESNLEQLKAKVRELRADVGIAFDGDGDRLGIVTHNGQYIPTDIYMIIIIRDIIDKVEKKEFLYDVKCSKSLSDEIERLGAKGSCYRTGNSYTKAKVLEDHLPFGGELSGHVYFNDRWPGFDSGMYAGLRLLEIMSYSNKTINHLLAYINEYYSTDELKFKSTDDKKFEVVDKVKEYVKEKGYSYIDIDGVRANFDDGWALVRCSNTGPNITARFEANTEERLQQLQNEFVGVINEFNQ